jgi:hypothetical protein
MGLFATMARRALPYPDQGGELSSELRQGLPARFEAVGEALAAGSDATVACAVVGRDMARDGADLGEALHGLRTTYQHVLASEPDYLALHALSVAWGEETLAFVHRLSCEDPLTGLASMAHVRTRLSEVYRGSEHRGTSAATTHALVVADLPRRGATGDPREDEFAHALWMVRLAETVRLVFPGAETVSQFGRSRLVVVSERHDLLGRQVAALHDLVGDLGPELASVRIWIEGLPRTSASADVLLDELARL